MAGDRDDDDSKKQAEARPARMVTLSFKKRALALPGEPERSRDLDSLSRESSADLPIVPRAAPVPADSSGAHDAWAADRMARTSLPPDRPTAAAARASIAAAVRNTRPPHDLTALEEGDDDGDALSLVEGRGSDVLGLDLHEEMTERFALGDFTGALRFAELLLGRAPADEEALRIATESRQRLEQLYLSRVGSLERIPRVAVREHEIPWLGLDHGSSKLLSRVDGKATLGALVDASGLTKLEALKILAELLAAGAIRFG